MADRIITLVEVPLPFLIKEVKEIGIQSYGLDNAYPSRMERLINRSVTARSAAGMLARFLIGQGFTDTLLNDIVVGEDRYFRPIKAHTLLRQIANSVSYFSGFYVRVQYDGNLAVAGLKYEDFKYCRFGKKDTQDYSGKIVIYDNWDRAKSTKIDKKDFLLADLFNQRESVINSQIKKAGDITKYLGQVYFNFIDQSYLYPVSFVDPVQYDADSENQISMFKNGELRRGFFLKQIIHHTQFENKKAAEDFKEKMTEFIGGGHEKSALVVEGTFDENGNLRKNENIAVEKIEQNINDGLFDSYEQSSANAIRKAYNAIPQILIEYQDSKLGTTSGEALRQASQFYNQMTGDLRNLITQAFTELFKKWKDPAFTAKDWTIKPLEFGEKEEPGVIDNAFARLFKKLGMGK